MRKTNHTFNELVAEYIKRCERQKSFKSKRCLVMRLAETFGNVPLRRFNSMILEQFQTDKLNMGKKPATVNRLIATIFHMFTKAVEWDMVEEELLKRMRKEEIFGLKWDNVDLTAGFILLNQDQTKNSERKEIHVSPTLMETLRTLPKREDVPYVFYNPLTGKRFDNVKRGFNTALKRAGIRDFRFMTETHLRKSSCNGWN